MTEKTIKRHVSTLRQLWEHVGDEIANPIRFDIKESGRLPWTLDVRDTLLRARWSQSDVSEETHAWFLAIGGYTDMRVESRTPKRWRNCGP